MLNQFSLDGLNKILRITDTNIIIDATINDSLIPPFTTDVKALIIYGEINDPICPHALKIAIANALLPLSTILDDKARPYGFLIEKAQPRIKDDKYIT